MARTTSFQGDGTDLLRSSVVDDGLPGKPAGRKQPRASRKAPTTLFNTDTANFRAMLQQFTGFASEPPPPEMVNQPIGGFHHQFGDQTQYAPLGGGVQVESQDQACLYQQNQRQQMFGLGNRIIESPLIISEYGEGGSNGNAN